MFINLVYLPNHHHQNEKRYYLFSLNGNICHRANIPRPGNISGQFFPNRVFYDRHPMYIFSLNGATTTWKTIMIF